MSDLRAIAAVGAVAFTAAALLIGWVGLDATAKLSAPEFRRRMLRECGAIGAWFAAWAVVEAAFGLWPLAVLTAVAASSFAVAAAVWSRAGAR